MSGDSFLSSSANQIDQIISSKSHNKIATNIVFKFCQWVRLDKVGFF